MNSPTRKPDRPTNTSDHTTGQTTEDPAAGPQGQSALHGHDIIVIGASAGGVEALQKLVHDLPADLPAALFVVVHLAPQEPSLLPAILENAGSLPVLQPKDGQVIELGHIYVAPPNYQMTVEQGIIRVVRGPRENRHRPAIDPLFRSAARYYGPRVIGVIMTGMLDDGVAGLFRVKNLRGLAVVQDPLDAPYPEMPSNALRALRNVDHVVSLADLGALLARLANEVPEMPALPASAESGKGDRLMAERIDIEDRFARSDIPPVEMMDKMGTPSTIACPDCHGTLWEIHTGDLLSFRCRVGHAYTAQSLPAEHSESLETALWVALRALEESASLNRRLAERATERHQLMIASRFMETAVELEQQADLVKRVLVVNKAVEEESAS